MLENLFNLIAKREYILAVYEARSFSKAAERLRITQPSLSANIKRVEDEIGVPIFNRKTRPISLTSFGEEAIKGIKSVDLVLSEVNDKLNAMNGLEIGQLSIGASNLSLPYFVPQKILEFKQRYPGIELSVVEDTTVQARQKLDRGEVNIIISNREFDIRKYAKIPIYEENLVVIVNPDLIDNRLMTYSLSQLDNNYINNQVSGINLNEFALIPFVLLNKENQLRKTVDYIFNDANIQPPIALTVERSSIAINFARLGIGASIVSNQLIHPHSCQQDLLCFKLNHPKAKRKTYLYYRRNQYVTQAMHKFISLF